MFLYYRMNDAEARLAPDIMVVFDAAESPPRPSWLVWREGGLTPDFVLEIASPGTVADDAGWKRDRYATMEVSEYWRFDPQGGELIPELLTGEVLDVARGVSTVAGGPGRHRHSAVPQRSAGAGFVRGQQRAGGYMTRLRANGCAAMLNPKPPEFLPRLVSRNWRPACAPPESTRRDARGVAPIQHTMRPGLKGP